MVGDSDSVDGSLRDVVPVDLPGLRAAPRRRRCGRGRGHVRFRRHHRLSFRWRAVRPVRPPVDDHHRRNRRGRRSSGRLRPRRSRGVGRGPVRIRRVRLAAQSSHRRIHRRRGASQASTARLCAAIMGHQFRVCDRPDRGQSADQDLLFADVLRRGGGDDRRHDIADRVLPRSEASDDFGAGGPP